MNNLLIGNGININFGGLDYTNKKIILRAIERIKSPYINPDINGIEILQFLELIFKELNNIICGKYDIFAITSYEKLSLEEFKTRYKKDRDNLKIYDVGFEDYFLMFELFCRKNKISNPERFNYRGLLKRFFINSIYNDGKIQELHKSYPRKVKIYLKSFDEIYTTNYDSNIEKCTGTKVNYLHGAFHIFDDVYNPKSFRNQLSDKPSTETPIIKGFEHLFSNVLTSFSGFSKNHTMNEPKLANSAISKFAEGIKANQSFAKEINSWSQSDDSILKNLGEAILLKKNQSDLKINEYYPIDSFKVIKDDLTIIGLSPYNDSHIFKMINDNISIKSITSYFYTKHESDIVKSLLNNKKDIRFSDVKQFWFDLND